MTTRPIVPTVRVYDKVNISKDVLARDGNVA